jgi:hypothetical protein
MTTPNSGHGHVYPRPDGAKARCGGPAICKDCALDQARMIAAGKHASAVLDRQYTDPDAVLTQMLDAIKGQLLILLVDRLGGSVEIPVSEVDHGTVGRRMAMAVDQGRRVFTFTTTGPEA